MLHFGAVDYHAAVYVNGRLVATHTGGYTSFSADATSALTASGPQQLVVAVTDTVNPSQPLRQAATAAEGDLRFAVVGDLADGVDEAVPARHIDQLIVTPHTANDTIAVKVVSASSPAGAVTATVSTSPQTADGSATPVTGTPVAKGSGQTNTAFTIKVPHARLWLAHPPVSLYQPDGEAVGRGLGRQPSAPTSGCARSACTTVRGVPRVTLNGRPVYLDGVLDQGYWPDGLYTAPTDPALEVRHRADHGGARLQRDPQAHEGRAGPLVLLGRQAGGGCAAGHATADGADPDDGPGRAPTSPSRCQIVGQLQDTTSIGVWILDNEHFTDLSAVDDRALAKSVKALDPTRLVDAHSGFFYLGAKPRLKAPDPGVGDIIDFHMYSPEPEHGPMAHLQVRRPRDPRPPRAHSTGQWVRFWSRPARASTGNNSAAGTLPSTSLTDRIVDGLNQRTPTPAVISPARS